MTEPYIHLKIREIIKIHELPTIHKGVVWEKDTKSGQTGVKQDIGDRRLRKFATCEILQVEKFSQPCKIPAVTQFLMFYAPFSLWLMTCSFEFGLDSSCLSRLNDFGIVSLQKLQNLPQNAIRSIAGTLMCQLG